VSPNKLELLGLWGLYDLESRAPAFSSIEHLVPFTTRGNNYAVCGRKVLYEKVFMLCRGNESSFRVCL